MTTQVLVKNVRGGSIADNDSEIPDNKCQFCEGGQPTDVDLKIEVDATKSIGFPSETIDKANKALKFFNVELSKPTFSLKGTLKECCTPETGVILPLGSGESSLSGTGSISATIDFRIWPAPGLPEPKITAGVIVPLVGKVIVTVEIDGGLFVSGTAKFAGTLGIVGSQCTGDVCTIAELGIDFEPALTVKATSMACVITDCFICDEKTVCASEEVGGEGKWTFFGGVTFNKPNCGDKIKGSGFQNKGLKFSLFIETSVTVDGTVTKEKLSTDFGPFFASDGS